MEAAEGGTFSLVTSDNTGTNLLAVGSLNKSSIGKILSQVKCTDAAGDLSDAVSVVQSLEADNVIVLTDGVGEAGASDFEAMKNSSIPAILGYVSATEKSQATVLIASEKDDPILSIMQYGLGHTVAWNTDVANSWSGPLAQYDDYVQLWKRIIDYSAGSGDLGDDSVEVTTTGGVTKVTYNAADYTEKTSVEATYTDPDGTTETAAVVQYSDEYKFALSSDDYKAFINQYGKEITASDNIWTKLKTQAASKLDLTKWLIIFAILWFVLDIGLRRFGIVPKKREKLSKPLPEKTPDEKAMVEKAPKIEAPAKNDKKKDAALDTSALLNKKSRR